MRIRSQNSHKGAALRTMICALGGLALLQAGSSFLKDSLFINISPSIPMGIYLKKSGSELNKGDTVVLKVSEHIREVADKVGLLEHTRLLFKRVGEVPGGKYCIENGALRFSTKEFPLMQRTKRGIELPQNIGCSVLDESEFLVVGDSPDSFDSRYFGKVNQVDVVTRVEPIITF